MNKFALFTTIDFFGLSTVSTAFVGGHKVVTDPESRAVQSPELGDETADTPRQTLSTQTVEK